MGMAGIVETRSLRFDKSAVAAAVFEYRCIHQPVLQALRIDLVEFVDGEDGVGVKVALDDRGGTENGMLSLNSHQLAAALLRFCFNHRTPLPRRARKSLRTDGQAVFLEFAYGWSAAETAPA